MGQVIPPFLPLPPLLKCNNTFTINLKFSEANAACRSRTRLDCAHSSDCQQNTVQTDSLLAAVVAGAGFSSPLFLPLEPSARSHQAGKERGSLVSTSSKSPDLAEQVWHSHKVSSTCWGPRRQVHPVRGSCRRGRGGDTKDRLRLGSLQEK